MPKPRTAACRSVAASFSHERQSWFLLQPQPLSLLYSEPSASRASRVEPSLNVCSATACCCEPCFRLRLLFCTECRCAVPVISSGISGTGGGSRAKGLVVLVAAEMSNSAWRCSAHAVSMQCHMLQLQPSRGRCSR